MVMRLSQQHSLEYLKEHGHNISITTYKKLKKAIRDNSEKRKFELIQNGLWEQHLEQPFYVKQYDYTYGIRCGAK